MTMTEQRQARIRELGAELSKLMTAARAVAMETAGSLHPGISAAGFQVLQWLHAFGPTKASVIAGALSMDRSALSRLAKELRTLGFVETVANDQDGRSVLYSLAEPARARIAEAIAHKGNLFEMRVSQWSDADLSQFAKLLRRLNQ